MQNHRTILDGLWFGEGPRWHDGALFFSDMHGHRVVLQPALGRAGQQQPGQAAKQPANQGCWYQPGIPAAQFDARAGQQNHANQQRTCRRSCQPGQRHAA